LLLMQEQIRIGPAGNLPWEVLPGQSLAALLALVGAKKMEVEALRARTRLSHYDFVRLLSWLQQEYLIDVAASLGCDGVKELVALTERGEATLVAILEKTCELPEFR
jgi:hypothetical protein